MSRHDAGGDRDLHTIAESFDARAETYARNAWHRRCAERLVQVCRLQPGQRVLDAATGTAFAAMAAARAVGPDGRVIGVDISAGMLREARAAVERSGLTNVELVEADVVSLPQYESGSFDAITCAAGLLYMPAADALKEWRRLLKPGGVVAFSTMRAGSPRAGQLFRNCAAAFSVSLRDPSEPLGSVEASRTFLEDAGLEPIRIASETIEFTPMDLQGAWESNVRSAGHDAVRQLSSEDLAALEAQYLSALERELRDNPVGMTHAGILYVVGERESAA